MPENSLARFFYSLYMHCSTALLSIFLAFMIVNMTRDNYEEQISNFDQITKEYFRLAAEEDMKNYMIEGNMVN